MDNDAKFLLSSASEAMEERERLRSKLERIKHEAAAWRAMQVKEAAALDAELEDLDAVHRDLDGKLTSLDELAKRMEYDAQRSGFDEGQTRNLKYGYLRGQVAGWAAEFERVTAITGVRFGEGKSDAVDKVVHLYSANELRNKSLFKFVTEDVVLQTDTLANDLEAEEGLATQIEAEQASRDSGDAFAKQSAIDAVEAEEHLVEQLEKAGKAVDEVLPKVEKLGYTVMAASEVSVPQHMEGTALQGATVPAFLALLEDGLHRLLSRSSAIVAARAPPEPADEEEAKAMALLPPEVVSDTLATCRALSAQRTLASGKDAARMLHNDSSERLLTQMG